MREFVDRRDGCWCEVVLLWGPVLRPLLLPLLLLLLLLLPLLQLLQLLQLLLLAIVMLTAALAGDGGWVWLMAAGGGG